MKTYDYINRVLLTLPISVYEGTWTYSPFSLLCIIMILRVRRNFFEITTFPNSTGPIVHYELTTVDALEAKLVVERDCASALRVKLTC